MGIGYPLTLAPARGRGVGALASAQLVAALVLAVVVALGATGPAVGAVLAAAGLGALAVSDAITRRVPAAVVRWIFALSVAAIVANACWTGLWAPVVRGTLVLVLAAIGLGAVWWATPGAIAFGDVKVTVLACAVAAVSSARAVVVMLLVACVLGGIVATSLHRRPLASGMPRSGVPFIPGLAVGFVVGVLVR